MSITKTNWLMLFKEIIAVYCDSHMIRIYTLCSKNSELLIVKAGGTYRPSYHAALKD
jgi:hypothetical protein